MLRLLLPVLRDAPSSLRIHGRHPRGLNLLAAAVLRPALRLLSTSTAASDYLVDTLGLTSAQTREAAEHFSCRSNAAVRAYLLDGLTSAQAREAAEHLSCRSNADAVRAYLLDGLGLSKAATARAVARKPQLLHSSVEDTLAPCVAELRGQLHRDSEIRRLVAAYPELLLSRLYIARFKFYKSRFRLAKYPMFAVLSAHPRLLDHSTNKVALNASFLTQFLKKFRDGGELGPITDGLPGGFILRPLASELHEVFVLAPPLFTATREELEAVVARAEEPPEHGRQGGAARFLNQAGGRHTVQSAGHVRRVQVRGEIAQHGGLLHQGGRVGAGPGCAVVDAVPAQRRREAAAIFQGVQHSQGRRVAGRGHRTVLPISRRNQRIGP